MVAGLCTWLVVSYYIYCLWVGVSQVTVYVAQIVDTTASITSWVCSCTVAAFLVDKILLILGWTAAAFGASSPSAAVPAAVASLQPLYAGVPLSGPAAGTLSCIVTFLGVCLHSGSNGDAQAVP